MAVRDFDASGHLLICPKPSSIPRRTSWVVSACVWLTLTGCRTPQAASGAQSETSQSAAEYDLAADYWLKRDQPRVALDHALKAVRLDDENVEAQHLVALLYLDFCRRNMLECRLPEAEHHARRALAIKADFREATNTLGVILIHQKRHAEAIAILQPLTQDLLYETPENAWGNLGWAYLENKQPDLAIEALTRSTAVQPNFCVGYYRLGSAYVAKADFPSALQAFTRAVSVPDPRCKTLQEVYPARADVLVRLGRPEEARSDLVECVRLEKDTPAGRQCAGLLSGLK
jgi:type IV pilus assembly protein PilF